MPFLALFISSRISIGPFNFPSLDTYIFQKKLNNGKKMAGNFKNILGKKVSSLRTHN